MQSSETEVSQPSPQSRAVQDLSGVDAPQASSTELVDRASSKAGKHSKPIPEPHLTPHYVPEHHKSYVELLEKAIDNWAVRNIAVTGAYGTGKSSILAEVARRHENRVVVLSLYTSGAGTAGSGEDTATNLIQKEIVKQLLYHERASTTRASRFNRIRRFRFWPTFAWSLLLSGLLLGFLFVTGLGQLALGGIEDPRVGYPVLGLLAAIVFTLVRWAAQNRVVLEKVTAGPATITLTNDSSSYFDKYLDEIMYYFEVSGRDIVILEDMDRFDDPGIFEALRALNTLVNSANQVKRRRRPWAWKNPFKWTERPPVKFIYALRDSVFETIGARSTDSGQPTDGEQPTPSQPSDAALQEIRLANRTKFFDQVIPIVPFITHRNARDLMSKEMEGTGVGADLISLAGRHVADMRLIKNMRTEFDGFAGHLLRGDHKVPDLTPDRLFAMILYKNVHMAEFEKIRYATSSLDKFYNKWRTLVAADIENQSEKIRRLTNAIHTQTFSAERSQELGDRLDAVVRALTTWAFGGVPRSWTLVVPQQRYGADDLHSPEAWGQVISQKAVTLDVTSSQGGTQSRSITLENLGTLLGQDLKVVKGDELEALMKADAHRVWLRRHTWHDLWDDPPYTLAGSSEGQPGRDELVECLGSDLAVDLVANGYINEYFALYVSPYYGTHVSAAALQYLFRAIRPGRPDMDYQLDGADVEAIITDQGEDVLSDQSMLNISVVDYLIANSPLRPIIETLSRWDSLARKFTDTYLANGQQPDALVKELAPRVSKIFTYLANDAPVDEPARHRLFDVALSNWGDDLDYDLDGSVSSFIEQRYREFPSLTEQCSQRVRARAVELLAKSGARLQSLKPLSSPARETILPLLAYRLTAENLRVASGSPDIALDTLYGSRREVYDYALDNPAEYLDALRIAACESVHSTKMFGQIISDAAKRGDPSLVQNIVATAAPSCMVADLNEVPSDTWPVLAGGARFPASVANIQAYIESEGEIDKALADLMAAAQQIEGTGPRLAELAISVIEAAAVLPSPQVRARLAASLLPEPFLDAADIPAESGPLVGLALENDLVEDDEDAFANPPVVDWETREFAISKSKRFVDFMSPALVPPDQIEQFMTSALVPDPAKRKVVESLQAYGQDADAAALSAIAEFAASHELNVPVADVKFLVSRGANHADVIGLLPLSEPETGELSAVLRSLGGDYAVIADLGRGRPLLEDTPAHHWILEQLQKEGIVSKFSTEEKGLRVYLCQS